MTARPILFSTLMVHALLAGTKTQTRRIVKDAPTDPSFTASLFEHQTGNWYVKRSATDTLGVAVGRCPYGVAGDRLWVQENHQALSLVRPKRTLQVRYAADGTVRVARLTEAELAKFSARRFPYRPQPGRFLYRSLSRILLEVTEVRLQRLADISHADARAEGIQLINTDRVGDLYGLPDQPELMTRTPIGSFGRLWASIHGQASWGENPWCWAISFRVVPA